MASSNRLERVEARGALFSELASDTVRVQVMKAGNKNFLVDSMPGLLQTKVTIADPENPSKAAIDHSWYANARERMASLFGFYREHGLLIDPVKLTNTPLDDVELRINDFTPEGRQFVLTGVTDRWLASFDRSPGKSPFDVAMLTRALAKLRASQAT